MVGDYFRFVDFVGANGTETVLRSDVNIDAAVLMNPMTMENGGFELDGVSLEHSTNFVKPDFDWDLVVISHVITYSAVDDCKGLDIYFVVDSKVTIID